MEICTFVAIFKHGNMYNVAIFPYIFKNTQKAFENLKKEQRTA